jgi:hypothetical protein
MLLEIFYNGPSTCIPLCVLVLFYFWLDSLAPRGGTTINNHSNHGDFTVVMGLTWPIATAAHEGSNVEQY